jgi:hypothetical protein
VYYKNFSGSLVDRVSQCANCLQVQATPQQLQEIQKNIEESEVMLRYLVDKV